jgi:DNA-directed RNA polymerase subunit RPC12/RpoP
VNLACPNRCQTSRFEAINANLYVRADGDYHSHELDQPLYRCPECGSPALDMVEIQRTIAADREAERRRPREYCCPVCEAFFKAPPEASPVACPECGELFVPEEKP